MSARKVEIMPKVKMEISAVGGCLDTSAGGADVKSGDKSPVVKNSLKGLIDQVLQFVAVGGDFA